MGTTSSVEFHRKVRVQHFDVDIQSQLESSSMHWEVSLSIYKWRIQVDRMNNVGHVSRPMYQSTRLSQLKCRWLKMIWTKRLQHRHTGTRKFMYATQFSSVRITWLEYEFREVRADSPQYVIVNLDTSSWTGVKETSLAAFPQYQCNGITSLSLQKVLSKRHPLGD